MVHLQRLTIVMMGLVTESFAFIMRFVTGAFAFIEAVSGFSSEPEEDCYYFLLSDC